MTVHRFFVDPAAMAGDRFALPDAISHQVHRVLRLQDGEEIVLLDGAGNEARCRLEGADCVVESRGVAGGEPEHRLTVWQALLRGDHLEPVIRHGTEIGIARFGLLVGERCVAREVSAKRLERLRAIAREAAEQSERGIVPRVDPPVSLAEALAATSPGAILLYERDSASRLTELPAPPDLVIGPEGGFAPGEVVAAERAGLRVAGLGPRILRSETVALAAAAVVLSRTGDFA